MNIKNEHAQEEESLIRFALKDEKGKVLIEFDAEAETAAAIVYLLERAGNAQRERLAAWMLEHGFATGHGDRVEDLLKELALQIAELRLRTARSPEEIRASLKTIPRAELAKLGIV